ncbi:response regulator [Nocardioides bruguierae]|uniref:response regulator n=1 Tax=Nocardioides bruguierae TaxID=2945102 RepID=UPI0020225BA5|nr:response regulator [Nocardioides bruguierae]MCL8027337.1 response regulator [Nocardioides bruguierae]
MSEHETTGRTGPGSDDDLRVLVVEDEARAAEAHAEYVRRVPGYTVAGTVRSAQEASRFLEAMRTQGRPVDLVLLDMHLPDGHGLGLLRRMRAAGHLCDVIAVTAARDADVVRAAVAQGVVLYLVKPFTFAGFRAKLEQHAAFRAQAEANRLRGEDLGQDEVDALMGSLRRAPGAAVPKGMSPETLREVTAALRQADRGLSASEVADLVGASRVTVRRYLEHLADTGTAERHPRYGGGGRPEVEYRWV